MPLCGRISDIFDGLKPCGVRIFDCMHRLKDAKLPEGDGGKEILHRRPPAK